MAALLVVKSMLLTMSVNEKRMKQVADGSYLVSLDVAEKLVQNGVPFRTAHSIAGRSGSDGTSTRHAAIWTWTESDNGLCTKYRS